MINTTFKTRLQIAQELNISYKTLCRKLKSADLDIPIRKLLTPADYTQIYEWMRNNA